MRVLHLSHAYGTQSAGGAAIAASTLHNSLLNRGIESHFACVLKMEEGVNVHILPSSKIVRFVYLVAAKLMRGFGKFTKFKKSIGINLFPLPGLKKLVREINPDVIHIHWINCGVCSFRSLSKLNKNLVINLHDLWMINAIDPCPSLINDTRYIDGFKFNNSIFLERWLMKRKMEFIKGNSVLFVGPSQWVCDECKKSIIGQRSKAFFVPNIIRDNFKFIPELGRRDKKYIFLFGCDGGINNPCKGFSEIEAAIKLIPPQIQKRIELWEFGGRKGDFFIEGVLVKRLGRMNDSSHLCRIYNAADAFLFASKCETQGMTKIEALLCGLPVVAFNRTACAEGVVDKINGRVVADGNINGFAEAMIDCYMHPVDKSVVALSAKNIFNEDNVVNKILAVYHESLGVN